MDQHIRENEWTDDPRYGVVERLAVSDYLLAKSKGISVDLGSCGEHRRTDESIIPDMGVKMSEQLPVISV
jgi:hypothetical protein